MGSGMFIKFSIPSFPGTGIFHSIYIYPGTSIGGSRQKSIKAVFYERTHKGYIMITDARFLNKIAALSGSELYSFWF